MNKVEDQVMGSIRAEDQRAELLKKPQVVGFDVAAPLVTTTSGKTADEIREGQTVANARQGLVETPKALPRRSMENLSESKVTKQDLGIVLLASAPWGISDAPEAQNHHVERTSAAHSTLVGAAGNRDGDRDGDRGRALCILVWVFSALCAVCTLTCVALTASLDPSREPAPGLAVYVVASAAGVAARCFLRGKATLSAEASWFYGHLHPASHRQVREPSARAAVVVRASTEKRHTVRSTRVARP